MGTNMTMDFYGKENALMYGMHTNEKIEQFVNLHIFWDVSLYCQTHYKMQNNINTHIQAKKKTHVVCRFHYPLPPMCEIKILKPFQINGNYPFSQQYLQT